MQLAAHSSLSSTLASLLARKCAWPTLHHTFKRLMQNHNKPITPTTGAARPRTANISSWSVLLLQWRLICKLQDQITWKLRIYQSINIEYLLDINGSKSETSTATRLAIVYTKNNKKKMFAINVFSIVYLNTVAATHACLFLLFEFKEVVDASQMKRNCNLKYASRLRSMHHVPRRGPQEADKSRPALCAVSMSRALLLKINCV